MDPSLRSPVNIRRLVGFLVLFVGLSALPAAALALELVSVASDGTQGNDTSGVAFTNSDGSYVGFSSAATNLLDHPVTPFQLYLRNRVTRETTLVSLGFDGHEGNNGGFAGFVRSSLGLSADGRYLAYDSLSTNLVASPLLPLLGSENVYLWDRTIAETDPTHATILVSVGFGGVPPDGRSGLGGTAISADGSTVAFNSEATNLVDPPATGASFGRLYVYSVGTRTMRLIPFPGDRPSLNGDGTLLAYRGPDIVVRNLGTGDETLANVDTSGVTIPASGAPQAGPQISADGRSVAFVSETGHIYVRHRVDTPPTTELVDVAPDGTTPGNGVGGFGPLSISADGRYVAFATDSTNLLDPSAPPPSSTLPPFTQIFVRDLVAHVTYLVSAASDGTPGNVRSDWPALSGDGQTVAFQSDATNLVGGDSNHATDVFVFAPGQYRDPAAFARVAGALTLANFDQACGVTIDAPVGGVAAGSQYSRLGVTFTAGTIFPYPGGASPVGSLPNEVSDTMLAGTFASPVRAVGITNTGVAAVLRVFDAENNMIGEVYTDSDPTTPDFVGIVSLVAIVRFEFVDVSGSGIGGDDLVFSQIRPPDCVPPMLVFPGPVIADAVSPSGAIVQYIVTATDDTDKTPLVFCKPASGSLFPIGAISVACTAKDATGNVADGSFSVIVRGADAQTKSLIDLVQGLKIPQLVKNALAGTLGLALQAETRGAVQLACAELQLFRFEVRLDLQLKLLSPSQAAALDKAAVQIRAVLGCQ
jgi:hypothetical protein